MKNRTLVVAAALGAAIAVLAVLVTALALRHADGTPVARALAGPVPSPAPVEPPGLSESGSASEPAFDKERHSTTDPTSVWVVVNKKHALPAGYRPPLSLVRGYQVATPAAGDLTRMLDDGDTRGLRLKIASAYRSYDYQVHVYGEHVAAGGRAVADTVSARPGHSEHQTGLAVDLVTLATPSCDLEQCFADTGAGRWLARSAWRYGFIVRYQAATTEITGYAPEPWHLRYVGRPLAAELHRTGVTTLEEFFGISGGGYSAG